MLQYVNPTMSDVAKLAGVSVKTVSNFFNDYPYMRESTRSKIQDAVDTLNYRVNVSARNLRSGRTGTIALVIPELDQAYFAELAQSVVSAAQDLGLGVFVETTGGRREYEIGILSGTRSQLVDGVILSPHGLRSHEVDDISIDFPLVLIGDKILPGPVDFVAMAEYEGAEAAVKHLITVGRQRIVALGIIDSAEANGPSLRLAGYRSALTQAGLPYDPELLVSSDTWHRAVGASAIGELIDRGVQFDAVFGFNDALALGAIRELQRRHIRVPEDVAIVGFDDTEDARFSNPPLSTIDPGRDAIARAAVALLARRIAPETATADAQSIVTNFRLCVRGSTVKDG